MTTQAPEHRSGPRFRERAVERASSSEQLDRMARIVGTWRWIVLVAILLLLAITVIWASVATVPTTASGTGYLLPEGGLRQVEATATGSVSAFEVKKGDHVVVGDAIGAITQVDGTTVPIIASETGVMVEIDAVLHDQVAMGDRVAVVEPAGWPLVVYGYVPTADAAGLAPGTPVQLEFGAGIADRYGFARGTVAEVSAFPATPERLAFVLQDASIVEAVRALGPSNEVLINVDRSAATPNGLVWGVGSGPEIELSAGLPVDLTFITGERHPIEDVLQ